MTKLEHDPMSALRVQATAGGGIYLGAGVRGPVWSERERAVLVLGPPRSGKTSSVIIPSVLSAPGAVVSTSTKPDVMSATAISRRKLGPALLYDPSGTVEVPPGVEPVRWSPIASCSTWDAAMVVSRGLVKAARSHAVGASPGQGSFEDHWTERAQALLAPLLHAAAVEGAGMKEVLSWVDRHQAAPALAVLDRERAEIAGDLLAGIAATEEREQSGIWSTASGVLAAYRSEAALATTNRPNFDASRFAEERATLYVCATGRNQVLQAPLVVGILTDVQNATYGEAAKLVHLHGPPSTDEKIGRRGLPPVLFALDEVANIAPLPDLPSIVSEGGGQGLLTLACLQDLSQARVRWGSAADGFLSLFGTTVVLPGIGDMRTLEALSSLAGQEELTNRSVSSPVPASNGRMAYVMGRLLLGRRDLGAIPGPSSITTSTTFRARMPVDALSRGRPGCALVIDSGNQMGWVRLTPWFSNEPWRSASAERSMRIAARDAGRHRSQSRSEGPELGI